MIPVFLLYLDARLPPAVPTLLASACVVDGTSVVSYHALHPCRVLPSGWQEAFLHCNNLSTGPSLLAVGQALCHVLGVACRARSRWSSCCPGRTRPVVWAMACHLAEVDLERWKTNERESGRCVCVCVWAVHPTLMCTLNEPFVYSFCTPASYARGRKSSVGRLL